MRDEKSKYASLTEELRNAIFSGRYPIGSKLPSVQALARRYRLSTATAHRSIQHLAAEGLVACHSNPRGTVVLRTTPVRQLFQKTTLACFLRPFTLQRNMVDNFGLEIIQGIQDEASARGYNLLIHNVRDVRSRENIIPLLCESWAAGIVVDQHTPLEFVRRLAEFNLPMVMFNRTEDVENLSVVTPDYFRLGMETARLFLRRGYERFAYYPAEGMEGVVRTEENTPQWERFQGYLAGLAEAGIQKSEVMMITNPDENPAKTPEDIGLPRRKPADWQRLAIFLRSDRHAPSLLQLLEKTDLILGRDVGLIGASDLEINRFGPHPFSSWDVEPYRMGRETVIELLNRIENPGAPRSVVKLEPKFVDRGTA